MVNRLRDTLGDSADRPRFIETVPRRGYRFIAPVDSGPKQGSAADPRPSVWRAGTLMRPAARDRTGDWRSRLAVRVLAQARLPSSDASQAIDQSSGPGTLSKFFARWQPDRLCLGRCQRRQPRHLYKGRGCGSPTALDDPSCGRPEAGLVIRRTPHCVCPRRRAGRRTLHDSRARRSRAQNRVDDPGARVGGGTELVSRWPIAGVFGKARGGGSPQHLSGVHRESGKRKLTSPPVGSVGDCAPAISPDGRTVAFIRVSAAGGIFLVPVAGGEPTRVTREHNPFCERLAWTASGRELVFSTTGGAPESSSSLWRVSASGGTPQPVFVGGDNAANPALSRRGDRLAYEQRSQDFNIWQIEVPTATPPSRSTKKLIASTRGDAGPQFSPDGTRIVFVFRPYRER